MVILVVVDRRQVAIAFPGNVNHAIPDTEHVPGVFTLCVLQPSVEAREVFSVKQLDDAARDNWVRMLLSSADGREPQAQEQACPYSTPPAHHSESSGDEDWDVDCHFSVMSILFCPPSIGYVKPDVEGAPYCLGIGNQPGASGEGARSFPLGLIRTFLGSELLTATRAFPIANPLTEKLASSLMLPWR